MTKYGLIVVYVRRLSVAVAFGLGVFSILTWTGNGDEVGELVAVSEGAARETGLDEMERSRLSEAFLRLKELLYDLGEKAFFRLSKLGAPSILLGNLGCCVGGFTVDEVDRLTNFLFVKGPCLDSTLN
jgi:hypothetical protein